MFQSLLWGAYSIKAYIPDSFPGTLVSVGHIQILSHFSDDLLFWGCMGMLWKWESIRAVRAKAASLRTEIGSRIWRAMEKQTLPQLLIEWEQIYPALSLLRGTPKILSHLQFSSSKGCSFVDIKCGVSQVHKERKLTSSYLLSSQQLPLPLSLCTLNCWPVWIALPSCLMFQKWQPTTNTADIPCFIFITVQKMEHKAPCMLGSTTETHAQPLSWVSLLKYLPPVGSCPSSSVLCISCKSWDPEQRLRIKRLS